MSIRKKSKIRNKPEKPVRMYVWKTVELNNTSAAELIAELTK